MRVEITNRCSEKYSLLLRLYCGMLAFVALCASVSLTLWNMKEAAAAAGTFCAVMCALLAVIPFWFGSIRYIRSGGNLQVERGMFFRRTLIINRSDIRCSEIRSGPLQRRLGVCTVVFFTGGKTVRLRGISMGDGRLLNRALCEGAAA
ncbi:MAG: PH domain-containing protein [Clostridia bacterium]|nr:PH domain-containing protein [Clostridia bacterium]